MDDSALILYLEDNPRDAELVRDKLQQTPSLACQLRVASNRAEYEAALAEARFDLILSDYALPDYDGMAALALAHQNQPHVPFILISGTLGEERAVDCMVRGATDYVLKQNLNRLVPAVSRALTEARDRRRSREAEESLRESEERFRSLYENATIGLYRTAPDGTILLANPALVRMLGFSSPDELLVRNLAVDGFEPSHPRSEFLRHVEKEGTVSGFEAAWTRRDGTALIVRESARAMRDSDGKTLFYDGTVEDVTERKKAEGALRVKNWAIESAINSMAMSDLAGSLSYVNPAFVRQWGYGSPAEILGKSVVEFWQMGDKAKEVAAAVRAEGGWSGDLVAKRKDGVFFDVHVSSSLVRDATGRPICMQASFEDITERKRAQEALRLSLEGALHAVSAAAETRDPYTAGHQRRVTALAVTIARELGLSDDECNTLRIAGTVHDIGKLGIPAEILSKPGPLSAIELDLIREHSQTASKILADVPFPGPVAEIVLQHHERLDGSGYPHALMGDQILREARILAVADVVEAMASHRPYREARGIDAALGEIEQNAGRLYDSEAVEACLRLFRDKGYALPA